MPFEFSNMRLHRIIVHQIFKRDENGNVQEPHYSRELTELDQSGLNALQERIVDAIGDDSHSLEMHINDSETNSTFDICSSLIDMNTDDFINSSVRIPQKLANAQNSRRIPGGIVLIITGLIGAENNRFIGIIKAEIHSGFTVNERQSSINLNYLSQLLLTPQQKFYKIGIFVEKNNDLPEGEERVPEDFKVFVYDHNMLRNETRQAARYFYEAFLGCTISSTDRAMTRSFYTYTKEYINNLNVTDEDKIDLNTSLYTYLKVSQENLVETNTFADLYIDDEYKDEYLSFMEEKEVPSRGFAKDLHYIVSKLRRRRIKFSSRVQIIAPSDDFSQLIQVVNSNNDETTLTIKGHIDKED